MSAGRATGGPPPHRRSTNWRSCVCRLPASYRTGRPNGGRTLIQYPPPTPDRLNFYRGRTLPHVMARIHECPFGRSRDDSTELVEVRQGVVFHWAAHSRTLAAPNM